MATGTGDTPAGAQSDYAASFGNWDNIREANGVFNLTRNPDSIQPNGTFTNGTPTGGSPKNFPIGTRVVSQNGIKIARISDGLSNTIMVGQKFYEVPPAAGLGIDWTVYGGNQFDGFRRMAGWRTPAENPPGSGNYYIPLGQDGTPIAAVRSQNLAAYPGINTSNTSHNRMFGSPHAGSVPFVFGDGSVTMLRTTIDPYTLSWLAVRDDGNVVNLNNL